MVPHLAFVGTQVAAVYEDLFIRLIDALSGEHVATLAGNPTSPICCAVYSADSERLACGAEDGTLALWGVQVG